MDLFSLTQSVSRGCYLYLSYIYCSSVFSVYFFCMFVCLTFSLFVLNLAHINNLTLLYCWRQEDLNREGGENRINISEMIMSIVCCLIYLLRSDSPPTLPRAGRPWPNWPTQPRWQRILRAESRTAVAWTTWACPWTSTSFPAPCRRPFRQFVSRIFCLDSIIFGVTKIFFLMYILILFLYIFITAQHIGVLYRIR